MMKMKAMASLVKQGCEDYCKIDENKVSHNKRSLKKPWANILEHI